MMTVFEGIAEFSRPYHLTGGVKDHQPVLLSTHADRSDLVLSFAELEETSLNGLVHRIDPNSGILLHVPIGQARDQSVILL